MAVHYYTDILVCCIFLFVGDNYFNSRGLKIMLV